MITRTTRAFFPKAPKCLMSYLVASGRAFAQRRCSKGDGGAPEPSRGRATPALLERVAMGGCSGTAAPATQPSLSPSSLSLAVPASAEVKKQAGGKSSSCRSGEERLREAHIAAPVGVGKSSPASRIPQGIYSGCYQVKKISSGNSSLILMFI